MDRKIAERLEEMRGVLNTDWYKYNDDEMASIIADLRSLECNLHQAARAAANEIAKHHVSVGVSDAWLETVSRVIHSHLRAMT